MIHGLQVTLHSSIREIPQGSWDALLGPDTSPFTEWRFLQILEEAGCVSGEVGWQPLHLTVSQGDRLLLAAPCYVKGHSEGEFIFDWGWAQFAQERGLAYYPKLLSAVPFTPATGCRLLFAPDLQADERKHLLELYVQVLVKLCGDLGLSSAHILFPTEDQAAALAAAGMVRRTSVQFHFHNQGYRHFDDFLSTLSSKKRHMLRRERREIKEQGIHVYTQRERFSPNEAAQMYEIYLNTVDKFVWGRRYLNLRFFELLAERMPDRLEFVRAHLGGKDGPLLAGAINLAKSGRLYGRYWGHYVGTQSACPENVRFLHFEVCYYHSIEECIQRGFSVFEPGAGGEHKLPRGFAPTLTHSVHYLRERLLRAAIADFVKREDAAIRAQIAQICETTQIG